MQIDFEGRRLTLGNKTLELEARIREVDQYKNLLFVRLDYENYKQDDPNGERNVVALNADGNIVWRIQQAPSAPVFRGKRRFTPYIGIELETGNVDRPVVAHDGSGLSWKLNPETGEVSDPIYTK